MGLVSNIGRVGLDRRPRDRAHRPHLQHEDLSGRCRSTGPLGRHRGTDFPLSREPLAPKRPTVVTISGRAGDESTRERQPSEPTRQAGGEPRVTSHTTTHRCGRAGSSRRIEPCDRAHRPRGRPRTRRRGTKPSCTGRVTHAQALRPIRSRRPGAGQKRPGTLLRRRLPIHRIRSKGGWEQRSPRIADIAGVAIQFCDSRK